MDRLDLASPRTDNGLWDWDLIANRIHYSSSWISMLGWGGTDFGNTAEEWFSRIHPEDSESVQREINTQIAQGSSQFEIPHLSSKDKDRFFFAPSQCSYALDGDRLTIKAGPRICRFKSAKAQTKADNRFELTNIYQNLSKLYSSK